MTVRGRTCIIPVFLTFCFPSVFQVSLNSYCFLIFLCLVLIRLTASMGYFRGWIQYDEQYRLQKAISSCSSWGEVDMELWMMCVSPPHSPPSGSSFSTQLSHIALMLGCLITQCPSDKTKFLIVQFTRFRAFFKQGLFGIIPISSHKQFTPDNATIRKQ
jgi:hypothetical protein